MCMGIWEVGVIAIAIILFHTTLTYGLIVVF